MNKKSTPTQKPKELIKLRTRQLKNGGATFYLAHWNAALNKWEYEFLKIYLVAEKTPTDKAKNREAWQTAQEVQRQRISDFNNAAHGLSIVKQKSKANFIEYCTMVAEQKKEKANGNERGTFLTYKSLIYHLNNYGGQKTTFKHVDKNYCQGFISYLKTAKNARNGGVLNSNTQLSYVKNLQAVLEQAIQDDIIFINPMRQIKTDDKPKKIMAHIAFLTAEEVVQLAKTECRRPSVKNAFLFSCYTGLRFSDITSLTWSKLETDKNSIYIKFKVKKTGQPDFMPLNETAKRLLPTRPDNANDSDFIFNIPNAGYTNIFLREWAALAGIRKHITFHVARHTYATLMLNLGQPIEMISENLRHSTTQITKEIYAVYQIETRQKANNVLDTIKI